MPLKSGYSAPLTGNRFASAANGVGSARKVAAIYNPNSAHTHSMLSQAARNPRLTNISSVSAQLKAHAGRVGPGTKGSKR